MPERSSPLLLEPEQLRTLLTLARHKTFTAAAAALGVQQSAISHQVRRVEQRLGRALFIRSGTGVEPTADGEALIIYAQAMFKLDSSVRRHFEGAAAAATLRIGLVEDLNRTALPTVLWLFSQDHPSFEFRMVADQPTNLIRGVREGRLDAALVRHRGEMTDVEPLWVDGLVWVGRSDTALPVPDPVPLVLPPAPSALRDLMLGSLQRAGRTWKVPFEAAGLVSLEAGLRAGLGVGALPASMELFGVVELDGAAGLPALPPMHYALLQAPPPVPEAVEAFCQVFRDAARLSFRTGADVPGQAGR